METYGTGSKKFWCSVWSEENPDNAGVWVKPGQSQNHQFLNFAWTPNFLIHALCFKFDPAPMPLSKLPRDREGRPVFSSEELGLKPGLVIPKSTFAITSILDKEPPRWDFLYVLEIPVNISGRRKEGDKAIEFLLDVVSRFQRKLGCRVIGKWDYHYNPYQHDLDLSRLEVPGELWELNDCND